MTVLAYIIVLPLSQFAWTAGVVVTMILGFLVAWLPDRVRMPILGLVGGASGVLLSVLFARLIFSWLVGANSFGWGPFLAATVPLSIPIWNDWKKYRELKQLQSEMPTRVQEYAAAPTAAVGSTPVGAIVGVLLSALLFL